MRKLLALGTAVTLLTGASLVSGLAGPTTAFGATTGSATPSVAITAGSPGLLLSNVTYTNFGGITLTGADQPDANTGGTANVIDQSGSGNGWHLTVQSTHLASTSPVDSISGINTAVSTATCHASVTCRGVAGGGTTGAVDTAAVTVLSALAGAGMGHYDVTLGVLSTTIPASAYATTYTTTVTVTLVSGP